MDNQTPETTPKTDTTATSGASTTSNLTDLKKREPRKISVKTAIIVAVVIVLIALGFLFRNHFVAAKVNGHYISRSSLTKELEKQSGKTVLDALITKQLIQDEGKKKGVVITQEEMDVEIKKLEDQIATQGGTLDALLAQENLSRAEFSEQVKTQLLVQKLLADQTAVTDEELNKYVTDNKVTFTKGKEVAEKAALKEQLSSQKLNQAATVWVTTLRSQANIKYYVNF